MKRHGNPYEVGQSGQNLITKSKRCDCCQFAFEYETARAQPVRETTCQDCTTHLTTGTDDEHISALYDHLDKYRTANLSLQDENTALETKVQHTEWRRERAQAAIDGFKHRQEYAERLLVSVRQLHEPDDENNCGCGRKWPCKTAKIVDPESRR